MQSFSYFPRVKLLYEALKFLPVQAWTSSLVLCGGWSYLSPDFGHSVIALRAVTDFSSAHDYAQKEKLWNFLKYKWHKKALESFRLQFFAITYERRGGEASTWKHNSTEYENSHI